MNRIRSARHIGKRVRQTPALFRNFPRVYTDLALAQTPWRAAEMTFHMRNGYTVVCPNADGARFPLYEIFADDAYDLADLCAGVDAEAGVLDVGGQIGSFALAVARELPHGTIHVYEASPTSAEYVRRNVVSNGLQDRVSVHAKALAAAPGEFTFMDSGTASGHNGLTAPAGLGTMVTVSADSFDHAVADAGGNIQIVKIDVEGAEYDIILSSAPSSWDSVRKVVMEYHPMTGRSLEDLLEFFAAVGLEPTRHEPGLRAGLGVIWLARTPAA